MERYSSLGLGWTPISDDAQKFDLSDHDFKILLLKGIGVGQLSVASSTSDVSAPSSNTAAVLTYTAVPGKAHVFDGIYWSFDGDPAAGSYVKVEDGSGNVIFKQFITTGGPGFFPIGPKKGTAGRALILTLSAGGSGVSGTAQFGRHWTE